LSVDVSAITQAVKEHSELLGRLVDQVERVVVGQRAMVEGLVIGLLCDGHVLLEGVPGLAKTLTVSTLARSLHARFSRVQFTPDLLPADLVGTLIYDPREHVFTPRKGPIFANIVLADEINRAPAKVQSALLEAMAEKQVTIGDETYRLPSPFLVLATQNPIEQEGTYPLPEAQVDRFMLKLTVGYPSKEDERRVLDRMATTGETPEAEAVFSLDEVRTLRELVDGIYIDEKIKDYIVELIHATREPATVEPRLEGLLDFGASPRATIALVLASRAHAFLRGRGYVSPQDVKAVAPMVLRHRLIPSYEAEARAMTPDAIINALLQAVPVP
jgi:MoxR-like ATPase